MQQSYLFIQFFFHILLHSDRQCTRRLKEKPISSKWRLICSQLTLVSAPDAHHFNLHVRQYRQITGMLSDKKKAAVFNIFLCVSPTRWRARDSALLFSAELLFIPALMSFLSLAACLHHRWVELWHKGVTPSQFTPHWHRGAGRVKKKKMRITKMLMFVFTGLRGKLLVMVRAWHGLLKFDFSIASPPLRLVCEAFRHVHWCSATRVRLLLQTSDGSNNSLLLMTNYYYKTKHNELWMVTTLLHPERDGISSGFKFPHSSGADLSLVFGPVRFRLGVSVCGLLLLPLRPALLQLLRRPSDVGAGWAQAAARPLQQVQCAGDLRNGGVGDVTGSPCPGQGLLPRPLLHLSGQLPQSHKVARASGLVGQFPGRRFSHSSWKSTAVVQWFLKKNFFNVHNYIKSSSFCYFKPGRRWSSCAARWQVGHVAQMTS